MSNYHPKLIQKKLPVVFTLCTITGRATSSKIDEEHKLGF